MKIGYCKICALDDYRRKKLEQMIRNTGHWKSQPCKPLSATQISYIMFIEHGVEVERHTIYKHMKRCMGNPKRNNPPHWNPKKQVYEDGDGQVIPDHLFKDRH